MNFMRLSIMKASHVGVVGAAYRKSHVSLVFPETWDATALSLQPLAVGLTFEVDG
jgi:hypothetical protein